MRQPRASRALPLRALRTFEAAARHKSFAAAAEELGVTPAAISHQIRALESQLGRRLFVRRHRAIFLAPAGRKVAEPLTALFAQLGALVAGVSNRSSASLEVSAMPSFAAKWLAPRLASFSVAYPACRVRVVGDDELVDLRRSSVDVGVRYGRGNYEGLHVERLMSVSAFPVCSPLFARAHARRLVSPVDLLRFPLLHDETSILAADLPNWRLWLHAAGVPSAHEIAGPVFDSAHMALQAAVAGQGVALGLSALVQDDLRAKRFERLFGVELASPFAFWFVCRRDRLREPCIAAFRSWMQSEVSPGEPSSKPRTRGRFRADSIGAS